MGSKTLLLYFCLAAIVVVSISGCASNRYTKKAVKFEEAGLYDDAADYYYEAVKRKGSNVEAKLGLRKNGQLKLDKKIRKIAESYKQADYEDVVYHYLDAESYLNKLDNVGVELTFPEIYKSYYSEAKNDFLNALYIDGLEKLNRDEFNSAEAIFKEIKKVDPSYKDVGEKYLIAKYEPVYRNASSYMENELYRSAYYAYEEVIREAGNYKQALTLKKEARDKGTIAIMINDFNYSSSNYKKTATIVTAELKSQLLELNNPFIKIIDKAAVKGDIYENGKINMQAANLAGISAILNGKVLNVKSTQGKLNKETKTAYLKVIKKTVNSEGVEVPKVEYKKTQYTEYKAYNSAEFQLDFNMVSTANNQIIVSDLYKLKNGNKLNYAKYDGDKNKLVPGYWKSRSQSSSQDVIKDNVNDVSSLKSLLRANQQIKPASVLLEDLIDQSVLKIVDKIDNYNPE